MISVADVFVGDLQIAVFPFFDKFGSAHKFIDIAAYKLQ